MPRVLLALVLLPLLGVAAPVPKGLMKKKPASLNGTWEVMEFNCDGKRMFVGPRFWTIEDGAVLLWNRDWLCVGGFEWKASADRQEGEMDRVEVGAQVGRIVDRIDTHPGVYESSGDSLVICTASVAGGDRPTDCTAGNGRARYEFKRVEGKPKK